MGDSDQIESWQAGAGTTVFDTLFPSQIERNGLDILRIELEHVSCVAGLPFYHGDPFDRLMVAQCMVEDMPIISVDSQLDAYGVKRLW